MVGPHVDVRLERGAVAVVLLFAEALVLAEVDAAEVGVDVYGKQRPERGGEKAGEEEILTDEMSLLPSIFGNRIPDILLSSAAYQQAALSNAGTSGQTASTPEEALVNVFCTFTTDDLVRTTTGSGFFIDPDGIIMTNAHVAQFLLLEETEEFGETDCIIRTGNPASPRYRAELLYLPPAWIEENADKS